MKKIALLFLIFSLCLIIGIGVSYANTYTLIIGINKYPYLSGGNLHYAVADANLFRYVIQKEFYIPDDNIYMLTDEKATRENIRNMITLKIRNKLTPNDTLIIYYSGHGTRGEDLPPYDEKDHLDEYIVPYDAKSAIDENGEHVILSWSAIRDDDFSSWVTSLPAKNIIIVFDSCYSGGAEKGIRTLFTNTPGVSGGDSFFQDLEKAAKGGINKNSSKKVVVFLASSRANEPSIESANIDHGYFTYSLYQALKEKNVIDLNKDDIISVGEIYSAVKRNVERLTHHKQHPTLQLSDNTISPKTIEFLAVKKESHLDISTSPSSSDIYIDNKFIGKTPINHKLKPGYHILTVKMSGYKEYKELIALSVGEVKKLDITLKKSQQKEEITNLDLYLSNKEGKALSGYKIALTDTPYSKITDHNGNVTFKELGTKTPIIIVFDKNDERKIIYTQQSSLNTGENRVNLVIDKQSYNINPQPTFTPPKEEGYIFSVFSIPELNLTIRYPKGWKLAKNNIEKGIMFKSESPESYLYEVYRTRGKKGETLDEYTAIQGKWLAKNYENYNEIKVNKDEKIGDKRGNARLYSYTYKKNRYEVMEFYFTGKDGAFYIALFDVPKGRLNNLIPLFEKLVRGIESTPTINLDTTFKEFKTSTFSIRYPKWWKKGQKREDIVFEALDENGTYIQLLMHKLAQGMGVEEYAKGTGIWLKKNLKNYREIKEEKYKHNSLTGIMRTYTYTKKGISKYATEYYFTYKFEKKNRGCTLIFERPEDLTQSHKTEFEKIKKYILHSLKLYY